MGIGLWHTCRCGLSFIGPYSRTNHDNHTWECETYRETREEIGISDGAMGEDEIDKIMDAVFDDNV